MKKIGIIGGLSPESTVSYYLQITHSYFKKYGNYGYPEIIIYSVNLQSYHNWREAGRWDLIAVDLTSAANNLQKAGADVAVIATNTMHKVFDEIQSNVSIPLINLMDVVASNIVKQGITTVGLLGTKYTMGASFYKNALSEYGISTIVPSSADQEFIHQVIIKELVRGDVLEESRNQYINIIEKLSNSGAKAIILGCTEIPLLIKSEHCALPVIDTAAIHAEAALIYATDEK